MDVGCYCVSGARLLAGEPEAVAATAYIGPSGTDWVFAGHAALRRARSSRSSTAAPRCPTATSSRRSGPRGRSSSTTRGTATSPVIELRRTVVGEGGEEEIEVEEIEVEAADPYRLELEAMNAAIRGDAAAALGRDDAIGQVRAIDALFRSAAPGATVDL